MALRALLVSWGCVGCVLPPSPLGIGGEHNRHIIIVTSLVVGVTCSPFGSRPTAAARYFSKKQQNRRAGSSGFSRDGIETARALNLWNHAHFALHFDELEAFRGWLVQVWRREPMQCRALLASGRGH